MRPLTLLTCLYRVFFLVTFLSNAATYILQLRIDHEKNFFMQCNELTTLSGGGSLSDAADSIQVLDLRCNQFEKLPEEVGTLRSLKVLYLHHNR